MMIIKMNRFINNMKYTSIVFAGLALMASTSCNSHPSSGNEAQSNKTETAAGTRNSASDAGFVKNANDLECKIVTKGTGTRVAQIGDIAEMHIRFIIGDTVMIDSYEMNGQQPVSQPVQAPATKGDLMEGLATMRAGDSMVFRIPLDTLSARANQPKPQWAKPGDYVTWEIKMVSVKTQQEADAEKTKKEGSQMSVDDKLLQDYFKAKGIKNLKKTASGMYYTVSAPGAGLSPKVGQQVSVNYTGENLKGEKFDSNVEPSFGHVEPFSFALGKHNVIVGWDEAVALMKKGTKARFYIPSKLAYGANAPSPKIGPNAILIFDIELLSFK